MTFERTSDCNVFKAAIIEEKKPKINKNNNKCLSISSSSSSIQQQLIAAALILLVILVLLIAVVVRDESAAVVLPKEKPINLININLTPPKQFPLRFLTALVVQLLLVTTNFKSELHHMLRGLTLRIKRHTAAIIYDLSETPAKKSAPPILQKRSKGFELCMNSKRRTISHRTSSNRHRKLQPFRYT
ncbi:uncharacterized protein LOC6648325 isoform X2 [Drosophila willistoni]|uniref:uncharacterized protein LOC6648325 isoform X2 n=1 Tax=Drosophila willistoni TaxID=7260 RepID=UPI000C26C6A1|nr:uncharacterized protein LOC6648325 isoform X2 [Drosophila willistoni]